jgi:hypothetical protein
MKNKIQTESIRDSWKKYSGYLSVAIVFLLIGMGLTRFEALKEILVNTISGLIINAPWFILIFILVRMLSVTIKESGEKLLKNIPVWIDDFYKKRMNLLRVERAVGR